MISVGTSSGPFLREYRCPEISKHGRCCQKLWAVHYPSEFWVELPNSTPNSPHRLERCQTACRLCYSSGFGFRSPKTRRIIDLVVQELVLESRGATFLNCSSRQGGGFFQQRVPTSTFAVPRELSTRTSLTTIRAQRISKEGQSGQSDYWKSTDVEDEGGTGRPSIWDANAEGVRRGRSSRRVREAAPQDRSRKNEWDYDGDGTRDSSPSETPQSEPWWRSRQDDDTYESDDATGEDPVTFKNDLLSWLSVDLKDAVVLLRWGLPAAVLLIPWLMGNSMMLLFGLTLIPAAQKIVGPIVNQIFKALMSGNTGSKSKSKRKRTSSSRRNPQRQASTDYKKGASRYTAAQVDDEFPSSGSLTTIFGEPNYDPPKEQARVRGSDSGGNLKGLGGWEELEDDRVMAGEGRWPLQSRKRTEKKLAKKERSLFIRLILAFFPFLRVWGGMM